MKEIFELPWWLRKSKIRLASIVAIALVLLFWLYSWAVSQIFPARFEQYDAVFARFESGDVFGSLNAADDLAERARHNRPAEASKALTLSAAIREHPLLGQQDFSRSRQNYVDAIQLDKTNGIALGHFAVGKLLGRFGNFTELDIQKDLRKAAELGDPWASYKFAQWIVVRTTGVASGIPKYIRRSIELGFTHLEPALMFFDVLQHRSKPEMAMQQIWRWHDSGSPYVFGLRYHYEFSNPGKAHDGPGYFYWGYLATIAAGKSDFLHLTELGLDFGKLYQGTSHGDRLRAPAREAARAWVRDTVMLGTGRWAKLARSCESLGRENHIFDRCVELIPSVAESCLPLALWRRAEEFERTPIFTSCLDRFVEGFNHLHKISPNDEVFDLK